VPAAAPPPPLPTPASAAAPPGAPPPPPAPTQTGTAKGDVTVVKLTRIQQVIARRMAESKATVPEFTLRSELDMEACVALRAQLKALGGDVPSYNDMVVKASALALREFPRANGSYRDGSFELHSRVNVGVAVAATDALVVPTIFDADRKSLREIARESRSLAERVRAGTVTPPELSGGTFTVSNLGMYGVTDFTAVINPPQAAILAVGALAPRAVVRAGDLVARHTMGVTLACDHRILYGADAAQFLARIRELLEQPLALAF
jgi:pyruvate dehydrogenase E2 component (dihydrolipoamide acetyltransferase)